jgi:hypothetical protein
MTIRAPATLPNSADSDPRLLGWMTGFPPPQDKTVIFADGSFHKFPQLRWHVRPLVLRQLKALMQASSAPHDERFWERYEDLRRVVRSASPSQHRLGQLSERHNDSRT